MCDVTQIGILLTECLDCQSASHVTLCVTVVGFCSLLDLHEEHHQYLVNVRAMCSTVHLQVPQIM